MTPRPTAEVTDLWGVAIPAWVGAGGGVLSALLAGGALWISILSFQHSRGAERTAAGTVEAIVRTIDETPPAPVTGTLHATTPPVKVGPPEVDWKGTVTPPQGASGSEAEVQNFAERLRENLQYNSVTVGAIVNLMRASHEQWKAAKDADQPKKDPPTP